MIKKTILTLLASATILFPSYSQTYLKRKVNLDSTETRNELNVILDNYNNPFRFTSKRCENAAEYLDSINNFIQSNDTASIVRVMCEFDPYSFSESDKWYHFIRNYFIRKDKEFIENYIESSSFVQNIKKNIDDYRFNAAKMKHTKEAYYEYMSGCQEMPQSQKSHIEEAEKQIFLLFNPKLYEIAPHREKLKDLITYLEDGRNDTSSYYFEGLLSTYLIYTNDGHKKSIENIYKNPRFETCMKNRLNKNEQDSLKKIFTHDMNQAELYERIQNNPDMSKDSMRVYIKNNPTKESSYRLMLIINNRNIDYQRFFKAKSTLEKLYDIDQFSSFILFPEAHNKLQLMIELFEESVQNVHITSEFGLKEQAGFGIINDAFITNYNYYLNTIDEDDISYLSEQKDTSDFYNYPPPYQILDILPEENEIIYTNGKDYYHKRLPSPLWQTEDVFSKKNTIIIYEDSVKLNDYRNLNVYISKIRGTNNYIYSKLNKDTNKEWPYIRSFNHEYDYDIYLLDQSDYPPLDVINTRYNEKMPFLINDTLYFSSNARYGFGGYDIYMSTIEDGKWSKPKNLGYGINSIHNEIAYKRLNNQDVFIQEVVSDTSKNDFSLSNTSDRHRSALTSKKIDSSKNYIIVEFIVQDKLDREKADTDYTIAYISNDDKSDNTKAYVYGDTLVCRLPEGRHNLRFILCDKKKFIVYEKTVDIDSAAFSEAVDNVHGNRKDNINDICENNSSDNKANVPVKDNKDNKDIRKTIYLREPVTNLTEGKTAIIDDYYFDSDKSSYNSNSGVAEMELIEVYKYISEFEKDLIKFEATVEGFADTTNTIPYNDSLSLARSTGIYKMIDNDINIQREVKKRIELNDPIGYGEVDSLGHKLKDNRRVRIKIKRTE